MKYKRQETPLVIKVFQKAFITARRGRQTPEIAGFLVTTLYGELFVSDLEILQNAGNIERFIERVKWKVKTAKP